MPLKGLRMYILALCYVYLYLSGWVSVDGPLNKLDACSLHYSCGDSSRGGKVGANIQPSAAVVSVVLNVVCVLLLQQHSGKGVACHKVYNEHRREADLHQWGSY